MGVMWDDEISNSFYQQSVRVLQQGGFSQYEVSNFARNENQKSIHNEGYWKGLSFIGLGPGASGRITQSHSGSTKYFETKNEPHPTKWIKQIQDKGHAFVTCTELTLRERILELLLLGLRRVDGIRSEEFYQQTGLKFDQVLQRDPLEYWVKEGVLLLSESGMKVKQDKLAILDTILSSLRMKM